MRKPRIPGPEHCGWCVISGDQQLFFGRDADRLIQEWKVLGLTVRKIWYIPEDCLRSGSLSLAGKLLRRLIDFAPDDPLVITALKRLSKDTEL